MKLNVYETTNKYVMESEFEKKKKKKKKNIVYVIKHLKMFKNLII
jgi:hypothetical protein